MVAAGVKPLKPATARRSIFFRTHSMILLQITPPATDAQLLPFPLALAFAVALGALIGSFLNVVIHRLPREESIVFPNSRCPSCGTAIRPYDNIPVVSYAILRGRCRSCRSPISARYPAVELLVGALFGLVFWHDGLTLALPFDLVFVATLTSLVFIDAEHMLLPDVITLPGVVFALIARVLVPNLMHVGFLADGVMRGMPDWVVSLAGALFGALVAGGSLWLVGWLWEKLRGVEAMGFGDVKMMFMVGAYLGWSLAALAILLAVVTGSLVGVSIMLRRRERDMQMMLPFGIFLGVGSLISLFAGHAILAWYLGRFAP
jgi:leader peptidase (prepilin peptidase)/N-methyltransferase